MRHTSTRGQWLGRAACHAAVLLAVGALAGCSMVYTVEPVGNAPVVLDPAEWDGYWAELSEAELCGEHGMAPRELRDGEIGCLHLKVVDAASGLLSVEWSDPGHTTAPAWVRRFETASRPGAASLTDLDQTRRTTLRKHGCPLFLTWGGPDDNGLTRLGWAWIRKENDRLIVWLPDADAFEGIVHSGALPGERHGGDLLLNQLDEQMLATMTGDLRWDLFEWGDPGIFVRVRADVDPDPN